MINTIFQPYWFSKGSLRDLHRPQLIGNTRAVFLYTSIADTLVEMMLDGELTPKFLELHLPCKVVDEKVDITQEFIDENFKGRLTDYDLTRQLTVAEYEVPHKLIQSNNGGLKQPGKDAYIKELVSSTKSLKTTAINFESLDKLRNVAIKVGVDDELITGLANHVDYALTMDVFSRELKQSYRYSRLSKAIGSGTSKTGGKVKPDPYLHGVWKDITTDNVGKSVRDLTFMVSMLGCIRTIQAAMIRKAPSLMWLSAFISSTPILLWRDDCLRLDGSPKRNMYSCNHVNIHVIEKLLEVSGSNDNFVELCDLTRTSFDYNSSSSVLSMYEDHIYGTKFGDFNIHTTPICLTKSFFDISSGNKSFKAMMEKTAERSRNNMILTNTGDFDELFTELEVKMPKLTKQYKKKRKLF